MSAGQTDQTTACSSHKCPNRTTLANGCSRHHTSITLQNNNRYLLVVQDYFTKWADAIPIPDKTSRRISSELVKLFSTLGSPQVLHSDQGRNFESALLAQTLQAFAISQSRTSAYHPQGDRLVECFSQSLLQLLRMHGKLQEEWEPFCLYCYSVYTCSTFVH